MAEAERIERGSLGSLARLTLLAPDIGEATLNGRQEGTVTLPGLMEPFPVEWRLQREVLAPKPNAARRSLAIGAA